MFPNNDIIWDSINTVFFLNINFKLLSIINHIKNRLPTMDDRWSKINKEDGTIDAYYIKEYYLDIKFLANYCGELFDYFKFDMSLVKEIRNHMGMDVIDLLKLPYKEQNQVLRKARKAAQKALANRQ